MAQFLYPDIGSQHIGNNFMSCSIISKNTVEINSKWADGGNAKFSNLFLRVI